MAHTFLWHDYETFGIHPRSDRPAQFAAIRTDADLNAIGEPINILCQPAPDYLPDPASCLVTGITPQHCLQHGLPEWQFARQINDAFSQPGTIGVGYNSIRFDDEFTRFLLWRTLIDPYAREWQHGCSRWDLLDVVRLAHALRPDGVVWPQNDDGTTSFRLEHLSAANHLQHDAAHDALSDVRATIALARLLKQAQPRLFDFALELRSKQRVAAELGLPTTAQQAQPFLHVSGMLPPERGCLAVMWPLASHPTNRNELIAWDLRHDPAVLATLSPEEIRQRLFTRRESLPEGMERLPVKTIHLNKSPMVVRNLRTLSETRAARWQIDMAQCLQHAAAARSLPDMSAIWPQVFAREAPPSAAAADVDADLYGGFVSHNDRRKLEHLRQLPPEQLACARTGFEDARLEELLWRYRARNFPHALNADEREQWQAHCVARLVDGAGSARTLDAFLEQMDALQATADIRTAPLLEALHAYAEQVVPLD